MSTIFFAPPMPHPPAPVNKGWRIGLMIALGVLTLAPYAQTAWFGFVRYDDGVYVYENDVVRQGLTFDGLRYAFTSSVNGTWLPLAMLSHMLDCQLYGLNAGGHHLTNVVIHVAGVLALFAALVRMTGQWGPSAFAAALFGVHPLHVESVAWISERKDVLSALFWMLTLLAYARYAERPCGRRYGVVALLYAMGLMSKAMLVTLPCVLLLLDYWPLRRCEPLSFRRMMRLALEKVPLFIQAAAASWVAVLAQHHDKAMSSLDALPLSWRVSNALVAYVRYLGKIFWPDNLAIFYPHPLGSLPMPAVAGAAAFLVLLTVLALMRLRRTPYAAVGWFWFIGVLVPVIGLVQVGTQAMADRYVHIPLIGITIALAWGMRAMAMRLKLPKTALAAMGLGAVVLLAVLATMQARVWRSSESLFMQAATAVPRNDFAHYNLGSLYRDENRLDEAAREFALVIGSRDHDAKARRALAETYSTQGRLVEAQALLLESAKRHPNDAKMQADLGAALLRMGRTGEAAARFQRALELDPNLTEAEDNLAAAQLMLGHFAEAETALRHALALRPNDAVLHNNLGLALLGQGKREDGIRALREALRIDPAYAQARDLLLQVEGQQ